MILNCHWKCSHFYFRSGTNHNFGSMDAAREIGGAVQEKFGWKVKMKGFDIEVVANVDSEQGRNDFVLHVFNRIPKVIRGVENNLYPCLINDHRSIVSFSAGFRMSFTHSKCAWFRCKLIDKSM